VDSEIHNWHILLIFAFGFPLAGLFGYLSQRIGLTSILGYLFAGYLIGPFSPGFVADHAVSEQLAEIGVVLMMFGVGLHFQWQDLRKVYWIALPGAFFQTLISTFCGAIFAHYLGWNWSAGVVLGFAVGVASTVVLVRLLTENHLLGTPQGHISVGWLLAEDMITVLVFILLPVLQITVSENSFPVRELMYAFLLSLFKCAILIGFLWIIGRKVVNFLLVRLTREGSDELLTLSVLGLMFVISFLSVSAFGTSLALGAFLSGMVVGQTTYGAQVFKNTASLRHVFAVTFFLSVGMLFNPMSIVADPILFVGVMGIVLILKPMVAFLLSMVLGQSKIISMTIAVALAQIGEFSFILAEEASRLHVLPDLGYDIIIAAAFVSIALNGILYRKSIRLAEA
jgi:CPA2 family monovalent cation:H+ antiporter-2